MTTRSRPSLEVLLSIYGRRRPTLAELIGWHTRRPVKAKRRARA